MNSFLQSDKRLLNTSIIIIVLLIVALIPRLYELGKIGFQKDEEYTAFSALAVNEGKSAEMPSGMPYRRAVPLTYLSAASAKIFGEDDEKSYRLPAALIGAISPIILFLLFRSSIGGLAAFIAALMLALSEWHILISREARMYAPFFLFYTCTAFYSWRWVETSKRQYLLASLIFFAVSVTFHKLTMLAAMFYLIPLVTNKKTAVAPLRAIALSIVLVVLAFAYHKFYVGAGYETFIPPDSAVLTDDNAEQSSSTLADKIAVTQPALILLLLTFGTVSGYWLAHTRRGSPPRETTPFFNLFSYYSLAIITGILVFNGLIYAAALTGLLFFTIEAGLPSNRLKEFRLPLGLLFLTAATWFCWSVWQFGLHDGLKTIAGYPFPYFVYFLLLSPGLFFLFVCTCIYLVSRNGHISNTLRLSIIATIVPVLLVGIAKDWGGARYLIGAYPFLIITAALCLVNFLSFLGNKTGWWGQGGTAILATLISVSGILAGNGLPSSIVAATHDYGKTRYRPALVLPANPDHQSAGRFVRDHLRETDIVVAEDASMQMWYTGRVDFWLRDFNDAKAYLYRADDGYLRDIYVSSRIVTEPVLQTFENILKNGQRIWVITSAETYAKRQYFLSETQQQWMEQIEITYRPAHSGRDKITQVYCLGCKDAPD